MGIRIASHINALLKMVDKAKNPIKLTTAKNKANKACFLMGILYNSCLKISYLEYGFVFVGVSQFNKSRIVTVPVISNAPE